MAEFMVVLRGNEPESKKKNPSEFEAVMTQYQSWVTKLRLENRYRGGSPFKKGSKRLTGRKDLVMIMDGPKGKHAEALTGYFVINAENLPEALEIAKSCPALTHGESIEIVELDN